MRTQFKYINHRGDIEDRDVDIISLAFYYENHPNMGYQPGWAISGWDYSRDRTGGEYRTFYLSHVILEDGPQASILMRFSAMPRNVELEPIT